jgi:hypothetical protein
MRTILLGSMMLSFIAEGAVAKTLEEAMTHCKMQYLTSNDKARYHKKDEFFRYCMRSQRFYRKPVSPSVSCDGGDNAFCYTSSAPPPPPPRSLWEKAKSLLKEMLGW